MWSLMRSIAVYTPSVSRAAERSFRYHSGSGRDEVAEAESAGDVSADEDLLLLLPLGALDSFGRFKELGTKDLGTLKA